MKPYFVIFALALTAMNAHAEPNKWLDAEGKVNYSDSVPTEATKVETVRNISNKSQAEAPAKFTSKNYAEREAELKKSKHEKEESAQKKTQQDANAEAKKLNCISARENARALEEGSRIVTYDEKGERTFLDDAARAKRLEEAHKAISDNCN